MIPKEYWTYYLSEVGRPIIIKGNDQLALLAKIETRMRELEDLQNQFKLNESELLSTVLQDWPYEEVQEAKIKSLKTIQS